MIVLHVFCCQEINTQYPKTFQNDVKRMYKWEKNDPNFQWINAIFQMAQVCTM